MYEKGLETFLAVAMSRTLREASNILNLSQSTVSYNLKNLETLLGLDLIDRKKGYKNIHLTPAGDILLPLAMRWSEIIREIGAIKSVPRHQLSIGCVESANHCILPDFYHSLVNQNINIKVSTHFSLDLYKMLEERTVDVAFVVIQIPSNNINIFPFKREKMVVLRSSLCDCEEYSTIRTVDLDPAFEVYFDWSFAFQTWHDHMWQNTDGPHFKTMTMLHIDSFLAGDERYWMIAPDSVANFYRKKGLKIQNVSPEPPERIYYSITHRKPNPSVVPALKIFEEMLNRWCERPLPEADGEEIESTDDLL